MSKIIPIWQRVTCSVCGGRFTDEDDWFARHSDADGGDTHDYCCPECNPDADE